MQDRELTKLSDHLDRDAALAEVGLSNQDVDQNALAFGVLASSLLQHLLDLFVIFAGHLDTYTTVTLGHNMVVGVLKITTV